VEVAQKIAEIKNISIQEVGNATTLNAEKLFAKG
jgi:Tat protein secretion system quality control protein TatD with DNase activity